MEEMVSGFVLKPEDLEKENKSRFGVLSLLPVEIWEHVLERLDDSKDIRNFCKAWKFPDWDVILHWTKSSWLFDEIFPLVFPYLSTKEQVLICRLVCKKWCKAVDLFLESNPCRRPSLLISSNSDIRLGPLTKSLRDKGLLHTELSIHKINKILEQNYYSTYNRNPIIGRSVHFDWSSPEDTESKFLNFLTKGGHHIWDFRIEIREDSPLKFFSRFQEYLKLLPNLKRLEIFGETPLVIEETIEESLRELQNEDVPLPQLPYLETLDATVFGQYRDQIMQLILSAYSANLGRLNLNCYIIPSNPISVKLENLTELSLSIDSDKQVESLTNLIESPIRRLTIFILRNSNRGSYPDFSKLFQTINTIFSRNLRTLFIEFPVTYTSIQWSRLSTLPTLQLLQLKTLELKEASFYSFNFLSQLKSLENLHLYKYRWGQRVGLEHHYQGNILQNSTAGAATGATEHEILDVKELLDNPSTNSDQWYRSNLWKVLPKLKLFSLSKASNLRAGAIMELCYRRPNANC